MDELKSLAELMAENDFRPFDAEIVPCSGRPARFHVVDRTPANQFIGWDIDTGRSVWYWDSPKWKRITR